MKRVLKGSELDEVEIEKKLVKAFVGIKANVNSRVE